MSTLVIEGGRRLSGRVDVEGNKNAALPLMAACLLTAEPCTLENVPRIADVEVMARLLVDLFCARFDPERRDEACGGQHDGAPQPARTARTGNQRTWIIVLVSWHAGHSE